jgi:hypothetical protein
MSVHCPHLDRGQQIIDKGYMLVSELAAIHQLTRVRDIVRSPIGTRWPGDGSRILGRSASREGPVWTIARACGKKIRGSFVPKRKQAEPWNGSACSILENSLSEINRSAVR